VLAYNECNRASVGAIDTAVMYILTEDRYRSLEYRQTREILPEAAQVRSTQCSIGILDFWIHLPNRFRSAGKQNKSITP